MLELNRTMCCGLRELHGIQHLLDGTFDNNYQRALPTPEAIIAFVKEKMFVGSRDAAFITFAAATSNNGSISQGKKLAAFIKKEKLGELSTMEPALNPSSRNNLVVWLWRVDRTAMKKFKPKKK